MGGGDKPALSAAQYGGTLPPARYNLAAAALAAADPAKPALRIFKADDPLAPPECVLHGELAARTRHVIAALRALCLPAGSVIAVRQKTGISYALSFLAITGAGHVALAMSPMLTARETQALARAACVRAVIRDETLETHDAGHGVLDLKIEVLERDGLRLGAAPFADTGADDPAYMVFTSGTGAAPKGVLHAHRAVFARRPMYADWYAAGSGDVFLHTGAMNWTYALGTGLLDPLILGATATFLDATPDPSAWGDILAASQTTILASVPGLYRQMLRAGLRASGSLPLRHALTAGEALRPALHDDWHAAMGRPICEAFGMSEISTYLSTAPGMDWRAGSPGKAQRGRAVAILPANEDVAAPLSCGEEGILAIHRSDPGLMLGYVSGNEEGTDTWRGDWFLTGDLAVMEAGGYVFPRGRADDVMNAMGYRVSPAEVEAQLLACPGVVEAAVASVSPREGVSFIKGYVVATPQTAAAGAAALLERASATLARYKQPRELVFVDHLPRTANGKVQRKRLQELDNCAGTGQTGANRRI